MGEDNMTDSAVETQPAAPVDTQGAENYDAGTNTSEASENVATRQQGADSGEDNGHYQLVQDENGKRTLKFVADGDSTPAEDNEPKQEEQEDTGEQTPSVANTAQQVEEQIKQPVEPYTLNELSAAVASGNVDDSRVPDEYKQQVAAIKIQQAQAAYNAQIEAQRRQQQEALAQQQLTPEQQREQQRQFLANLEQEAGKRAAQDVGLSEDEVANLSLLDDDDPRLIDYKLAKNWRKEEIVRTLQNKYAEENMARQKRAEIYGGINAFVADAKKAEPNFDAIDKFMTDRVGNLPYKEASELIPIFNALSNGTITEPQAVRLRQYYEQSRKDYYAQKNKLSTTPRKVAAPPVTERAGNGSEIKNTYKPDYNALRNASVRERYNWMAEYLRNQNQ